MINTREIASEILQRIYKKQHLDKICDDEPNFNKLDQRDKNFVRLTILETLRRNIQIDSIEETVHLSLVINYNVGNDRRRIACELLQKAAAKVGVEIVVEPLELVSLLENLKFIR